MTLDRAVQERRAQVGTLDLHYWEHGAVQPVVVLHGGLATADMSWSTAMDALAGRYRVVAPDAGATAARTARATASATTRWPTTSPTSTPWRWNSRRPRLPLPARALVNRAVHDVGRAIDGRRSAVVPM